MNTTDALWEAIEKLNRRLAILETLETAVGSGIAAHAASHQNAGSDEISVAGLSGLLADDQNPVAHAADHQYGGGDAVMPLTALQLSSTSQTIAGGIITAAGSFVAIDTEGGAATDDLDTINGMDATGAILILRSTNSARDVVCKDATGNLDLAGDFTLANGRDTIMLIRTTAGGNWRELCRSTN